MNHHRLLGKAHHKYHSSPPFSLHQHFCMDSTRDQRSRSLSDTFLSRLREAEQRDTEQNRGVMHHLAAMHALDMEVLDGIEDRGEDSSVVMPSVDEIRQLIKLAWAGSSLLRRAKHDSFTSCEGDFAMRPIDAIDQETFEKFMMVVQHPAEMRHAGRFHSAAQRRGWSTLFLSIDADRTNSLTLPELARFLERQQRAQAVALDALKEEQSGTRIHLPRDAAAKGKGAAATAAAMVAAAAAAAAGKAPPPSAAVVMVPPKAREARERLVQNNFSDQMARLRAAEAAEEALSAAATEGFVADDLFDLTASVAPPLFQCVEARLFLCRQVPNDPGGHERSTELYTHPPAGRDHEIVIAIDSYTLPGYTMVTKEPQNVPNVRLCSRFDPEEYGHLGYALPGEAIRSTLCIPIFAERPEEDAPAGARPPAVGCLQLFNRVPRGVAWNADRSTYDGPVEFHSRDLAQARSFCEKLSPAISAGQRVQQRLDAEEAVRAAEKARRLEELQRRKAYVEQQNASFVAHKERAGGHGDERAGGHGDELVHGHGHVHKHGRHDGRGHGPSPPSPPSVAAAASSPSVPAPVPVAAAPSSSGPATATAQRPAQPKASPNVDTKPAAAAQRTAAAPPPALPTPPPTPPRKSKFDTLKTTPRKSLKKKKKPETQG